MTSFFSRLCILSMLVLALAAVAPGCEDASKAKRQQLETRVQEFVAAINAKDYTTEYTFLTPEDKAAQTLNFYVENPIVFREMDVVELQFDPGADNATAVINATVKASGFVFKGYVRNFTWRYIDGKWYLDVPKLPKTGFPGSK